MARTRVRAFSVLFAVALLTPGLAPAAAADDGGEPFLGDLRVRRTVEGFRFSFCVGNVSLVGRTAAEIPHEARIYVNGALATAAANVLRVALPPIGAPPSPCGSLLWASLQLPLQELAQAGVDQPSTASWEYFDVRVELDVDGDRAEATRAVAIGGGPPQSVFNSAVPTPQGVRIGGWIMDPTGAAHSFMVTVDGRVFPGGEAVDPSREAFFYARHLPVTDVTNPDWLAAGLGTSHGIGILVPYGRICVFRLIDKISTAADGFEPVGCRTTVPGEVSASFNSVAPHATGARIRGSLYNPWIGPERTWPGVFLVPDRGSARMVLHATRRTALAPQYGEISGWFDFDVNLPLPPGRRTVCIREIGEFSPPMWWPWAASPHSDDILTCRVIQVPHAPVGATDITVDGRRVTVRGWAVDLNGGSPRILVSVNGAIRALTRTREPNADIRRTVGGDGRSGFTVRFDLPPGTHRVCTAWEDTSGGGWSQPSCDTAVVK